MLAKIGKVAFAEPVIRRNRVWQLVFTEYQTTACDTWRLAGCADYYAKYEFGWHVATTTTTSDAIAEVELATPRLNDCSVTPCWMAW